MKNLTKSKMIVHNDNYDNTKCVYKKKINMENFFYFSHLYYLSYFF